MTPEEFMQVAILEAKKSGTPYGAVIVKDQQIIEQAGNSVQPDYDPTAHAELSVIRKLTTRLGVPSLEPGYSLYTTFEPCPMCAAACVWANISEIVYGAGADDFEGYNPNGIDIRCQEIIKASLNSTPIRRGVLLEECKQLHVQEMERD